MKVRNLIDPPGAEVDCVSPFRRRVLRASFETGVGLCEDILSGRDQGVCRHSHF